MQSGQWKKRRHWVDDRATLLGRARAGEWLRTGEAAEVIRVDRRTIHNMIKDGRLRSMPRAGGRQRLVHPGDVVKLAPPEPSAGD
jgi:excisionase family DNA binding protein